MTHYIDVIMTNGGVITRSCHGPEPCGPLEWTAFLNNEIYCYPLSKKRCRPALRSPPARRSKGIVTSGRQQRNVSNYQPHEHLLNRLFRRRSKKTSKLRVTGLCAGNSPGPVNSPHKRPVTRKMFPFDDVNMGSIATGCSRGCYREVLNL